MENAAQPANPATHEWMPQTVSAHNQRAKAFAQTGTHLRLETDTLFVTSSRGFGRELPPLGLTRPPFKNRRYTVDVSLATGVLQYQRDYAIHNYEREPEDLSYPIQSIANMDISARETDEPVQRRTQLTLPDPLRYRELHRWGRILPHMDSDKYPGVDGWWRFNNDTYTQFSSHPLRNEDFLTIMDMTGDNCWYRDDIMDAALALCSIYYGAEDNEIMIVGSAAAQAFKFAAMTDGELDMNELRAYAPLFQGKKWIFMPLNDGIGETSAEQFRGSHWSLLAIDRPNKKAHYIDGLGIGMKNMAKRYACALQKLIGDGGDEEYKFSIEWNAPHQWDKNFTPHSDWGPCGPYVLKMIKIMMDDICTSRNAGCEAEIGLHLEPGFSARFDFNSYAERRSLEYTIASFKADQVTKQRATIHAIIVLGLPRPLEQTGFDNITWSTYDAPLFTEKSLTLRNMRKYREIAYLQYQRHTSIHSDSSNSSSGGISIQSEASGTHRGFHDGAQDDRLASDVEMQDRSVSTAVHDNGGVRIEEVFDDNDELLPDWVILDQTQGSPSLESLSSPIYNAPQSGRSHEETVHSDVNTEKHIDQVPAHRATDAF